MSIISVYFLMFLFFSVILFYLFPKKIRWICLLISSIIFFLLSSSWNLIFYLLFGIIITYIGARLMDEKCKINIRKTILFVTLFLIILELFVLKYINIFPLTANLFGEIFNINLSFATINLIAPLGISYYTLSLIGYLVDVYRNTCKSQKNILKHALFACYYPVMISGPIIRYSEMENEFFKEKKFNINNIYQGFARIIYGLMKKMVIADSLSMIVIQIFSDYHTFSGYYIVYGLICYAIQIYTDFSGCMDIVIGASKMYGVVLPENFESPLFSRTLPEFWRRWHITLGTWSKDYILYPLLKTSIFQKIGFKCKAIFGKKIGKEIPTILAIFILWLLIGLWHGAIYRYIFAAGILPWFYFTASQLFSNIPKKVNQKFHIKTDCFSFHLFQSLRTMCFMCFIWLFVCSPSLTESLSVIKAMFIIVDLNLFKSLPALSWIVLLMFMLILIVDYLKYREINVLEKFQEQNLWFRWFILFLLIFVILLYGCYGPGYNPTDFIYGGF